MSFKSGTDIFDDTLSIWLKTDIDDSNKKSLILHLMNVLSNEDWSWYSLAESVHIGNPILVEILEENFPQFFEEYDD